MNLKQRISFLAATLLPALALFSYFVISPAKTSADSCPPGTIYSPCSGHPGECGNGAGECFANGSKGKPYLFCNTCNEGHCSAIGGPGDCNSGCVTCDECTPSNPCN